MPAMPSDLPACFGRLVTAPKLGPMTKREVYTLITQLRRSELEKAQCGERALAFYDRLREGLGK